MSSNIIIITTYTLILDHYSTNLFLFFFRFGSNSTQLSSIVYTGSEDGTIKLWDLRLKEPCVSVFKGFLF